MENIKDIPVVKNTMDHRYEMMVEGHTAFILYKQSNSAGTITLIHTEVPKELEGKGVGSVLVEKTLQSIEQEAKQLIPVCPFVIAYLRRHPDWNRILYQEG